MVSTRTGQPGLVAKRKTSYLTPRTVSDHANPLTRKDRARYRILFVLKGAFSEAKSAL